MKDNTEHIVKIAKALSDKTRVKMLREIAHKKSITCSEAEKIAHLAQPTVSHHLKILQDAGLLNSVKEGRFSIISINKKAFDVLGRGIDDILNG